MISVLLYAAWASIGSGSSIPPAMLLGCVTYAVERNLASQVAYIKQLPGVANIPALVTALSCAGAKNTSPHSAAAEHHDGTGVPF